MFNGPLGAPETATYSRLSHPAFGAASSTQLVAPRNGGVMKVSITIARTNCLHGMSVRATAQAIGTVSTMHSVATPTPSSAEFQIPCR